MVQYAADASINPSLDDVDEWYEDSAGMSIVRGLIWRKIVLDTQRKPCIGQPAVLATFDSLFVDASSHALFQAYQATTVAFAKMVLGNPMEEYVEACKLANKLPIPNKDKLEVAEREANVQLGLQLSAKDLHEKFGANFIRLNGCKLDMSDEKPIERLVVLLRNALHHGDTFLRTSTIRLEAWSPDHTDQKLAIELPLDGLFKLAQHSFTYFSAKLGVVKKLVLDLKG